MPLIKFGLSFLPDASPKTKSPQDYYKDAIEMSVLADQAGFTSVKMTQHYLHPYGGYCPSPLMFLTAVACQTKQIRLMTGCVLPVFHHPIILAAEMAMLDVISNGRLDAGFARAYLPLEFDAFQIDMDESRARYTHTIETVIRLWSEENVSVSTPFFSFNNANNFPETIQKPHPPLWGAAVSSRQSFVWLGEQGFNLLLTPPTGNIKPLLESIEIYRSCFIPRTSTFISKPQIALSLPLIIHEHQQQALAISDKLLQHYLDVWSNATTGWAIRKSSDYPKYTGLSHILRSNTPHLMREQKQALVGCPSSIIDAILELKETYQINYFLWQIDTGAQTAEISRKTINLFIEKVLPKL